jgi:hypothetical protein
MRFFVAKQDTEMDTLGKALFKANRKVMTDRLQAANPHVDFSRVSEGTVLLVPDDGDAKKDDAPSIGQAGFERFEQALIAAFRATAERIRRDAHQQQDADKEAAKLLKSASIRKLAESDALLRERIDASAEHLHARVRDSSEVDARLASIEGGLMEEIGKLQRLFRS